MKAKTLLKLFPLMFLPLVVATSCSDDNDLPDVEVNVDIDGGVVSDGQIYVTPGSTLKITGVNISNNESGKKAIITGAYYYWDYRFVGSNVVPPYGYTIEIPEDAATEPHLLEISFPIFAEGKTPADGVVAYTVNIVSQDNMPTPDPAMPYTTPTVKERE